MNCWQHNQAYSHLIGTIKGVSEWLTIKTGQRTQGHFSAWNARTKLWTLKHSTKTDGVRTATMPRLSLGGDSDVRAVSRLPRRPCVPRQTALIVGSLP